METVTYDIARATESFSAADLDSCGRERRAMGRYRFGIGGYADHVASSHGQWALRRTFLC